MEERSLAYASYWRNSLADAELGRGGLNDKDIAAFTWLVARKSELESTYQKPRRELKAAVDALVAEQIHTVLVRKVHSKIVIGDENVYCVGSFNWFSARRDEDGARHETSLVYRGSHLMTEVKVMKQSLEARVARFGQ